MITKKEIQNAYAIISSDIKKTPLVYSKRLSEISGANVYLKMEQLQHTGSFKIRGVLNKMSTITDFNKTFVAASTGNHAAAFGLASSKFGFKGVLFLPEHTPKVKLDALVEYPIEKRLYGTNSVAAERKARSYANDIDGILIHPYNDRDIIMGQGTISIEIEAQLPEVDSILVPIGGGGLAAGICSYFKGNKKVSIIGCQPKHASEMYDSILQNRIIEPSALTTIADAAAGGIEKNAITFDICKADISKFEILDEESIKKAIAFMIKHHDCDIEPTAALPIAALLTSKDYNGKDVVLILTGKKINKKLQTEIIEKYGHYY